MDRYRRTHYNVHTSRSYRGNVIAERGRTTCTTSRFSDVIDSYGCRYVQPTHNQPTVCEPSTKASTKIDTKARARMPDLAICQPAPIVPETFKPLTCTTRDTEPKVLIDPVQPEMMICSPPPIVNPDLEIEDVDLNIPQNAKQHKTDEYNIAETLRDLVIRRGQTFEVCIRFNKPFEPKKHDLRLVFLAGDNPIPTKGTRVSLILSDEDKENEWGAWIVKQDQRNLTLRINSPPTTFVGVWSLMIETLKKTADNKNVVFEYSHDQQIYILFNPWCKDDPVYFSKQELLNEYILNETGKIFIGNGKQINGKKWNFGQFEENILDCAMFILDKSNLAWPVRGDPVKISRKLSAMVNSNDDGGVLVGRWGEPYNGGTSPLAWGGSVAILNEYFKTKNSVCYGQCWVFSGVLTTLCRALGIPARSVTNFESAHDCDGTITIDTFWGESGEPETDLNHDSIWNFHVWNEVWMARRDLPEGYGGWQAIDATPQETSEGVMCCGPASLEAVKRGEVHLPYDTSFIFAEANADLVYWELSPTGEYKNAGLEKRRIGKHISTKLPKGQFGKPEKFCNDLQREDLTNLYKFPEGSEEERTAVIRANQESTIKLGLYEKEKKSDVEFELEDIETVPYGEDYKVILIIKNTSKEERTVDGTMSTSSIYYTGVPANKIKVQQFRGQKISPKGSARFGLNVSFDDYYPLLVDQCHLQISCMFKVVETKQTYAHQDTFRLIKPDLTIKAPSRGKVWETVKAEISFENPLPCTLTGCQLTVEGPGLQHPVIYKQRMVLPKHTFIATICIEPRKPGVKELVAVFNSKELSGVEGSIEITISGNRG